MKKYVEKQEEAEKEKKELKEKEQEQSPKLPQRNKMLAKKS